MQNVKNARNILAVFALSNMSALIYQISWTKNLSYIFGTSVYAVGTVLACFMAGLAFGSFVFGKRVDKSSDPVRLFAYVEIALGLFALLLIPIFALLPQPYSFFHKEFEGTGIINFLFFALSFQVLIIPTSLIGGTFPIMNRIYSRPGSIGKDVGTVYSIDTIFAAIGALLAGFFLLPNLGISKTIVIAVIINLASGVYLYMKSGSNDMMKVADSRSSEKSNEGFDGFRAIEHSGKIETIVLLSFFLSGFAALVTEVVWIRFFSLTFGTSVYAISIITASFLIGLSIGSFIISRYIGKIRPLITAFAFIEIGIAFSGLIVLIIIDRLDVPYLVLYNAFNSYYPFTASLFFIVFLIILFPTALMGATMPVAGKLISNRSEFIGTDIGAIYTVNTFGAIFGTFFASFILIPALGMTKTGALAAGTGIFIAILLFAVSEGLWKKRFLYLSAISIILCIYLASSTLNPVFAGAYYHGTQLKDVESWKDFKSRTEVLHFKEGLYGLVSVVKNEDYIAMRIDGKSESSNVPAELVSEHQLAYIPIFAHNSPENLMLIGLGGGFTLDAITNFDGISSIDLVEINPNVVEAAGEYLSKYNNNALGDARIKIIIDDGRNYLRSSEKKYDIIISQPSNIWLSGEGGLFTKEMYMNVKDHLNDDGIFGQWMPLYEQDTEDFRIFLATFISVFPYTDLWIVGYDAILVGSKRPIRYDYGKIKNELASNLEIRSDFELMSDMLMAGGKYRKLYQMMIPYRMSGIEIDGFSGKIINTDDHPVLEFSTARNTIYPQNIKKPFDDLNRYLSDKYDLILIPPFSNLSSRDNNRVYLNFMDADIGIDGLWKEIKTNINVDHGRNSVYMEAAYNKGGSRFFIIAIPLPDEPSVEMIKENVMNGMNAKYRNAQADSKEIIVNGHWGYEIAKSSGEKFDYSVSWFCEHNDIIYSVEIININEIEAKNIIESIKCIH